LGVEQPIKSFERSSLSHINYQFYKWIS